MSNPSAALIRSTGFQEMDEVERRASAQTLRGNRAGVALWDRCFGLYVDALSTPFEFVNADSPSALASCNLRMNWLVMSARNSKFMAHGVLGAYYTQCFALLRIMSEAWRRIVYVRLDPNDVWRFVSPDPFFETIGLTQDELAKIGRLPTAKQIGTYIATHGTSYDRSNDSSIRSIVDTMHDHAHPSDRSLHQIVVHRSRRGVGSFYDQEQAHAVQVGGILLSLLSLQELDALKPQSVAWLDEFARLTSEYFLFQKQRPTPN